MKKIILNILTHGDEHIGLKVASEIQKLSINEEILTIQIANPQAHKLGQRFVDQDLNRTFPGMEDGNYEQQRAFTLLPNIESSDLVIDIHSTTSQLKDAIIVTKLDEKTLECIRVIQPKYVLIMEATGEKALISHAAIGLAFEYGQDNDPGVLSRTVRDITRLFAYLRLIDQPVAKRKRTTRYFRVKAEVEKPKGFKLLKQVKNYKIVRKGEVFATRGQEKLVADKDFYPILFGQDNYEHCFGFQAIELKSTDDFI